MWIDYSSNIWAGLRRNQIGRLHPTSSEREREIVEFLKGGKWRGEGEENDCELDFLYIRVLHITGIQNHPLYDRLYLHPDELGFFKV